MTIILNEQTINTLYTKCQFLKGEQIDYCVIAPCIHHKICIGFSPTRISEHQSDIVDLFKQLPEAFTGTLGIGASFLDIGQNNARQMWTDSPIVMEKLVLLGIAAGATSYVHPREEWRNFERKAPYVVVHTKPKKINVVKMNY
jgi:hypothetical protein